MRERKNYKHSQTDKYVCEYPCIQAKNKHYMNTHTKQHTSSCKALICSQPITESQQHYGEEGV